MKVITNISVGGILIAIIQHCVQDLLIAVGAKSTDQGKKDMEDMFTQETMWEL